MQVQKCYSRLNANVLLSLKKIYISQVESVIFMGIWLRISITTEKIILHLIGTVLKMVRTISLTFGNLWLLISRSEYVMPYVLSVPKIY